MTGSPRPPLAVHLGDQMHAEMLEAARQTLLVVLDREGLQPNEDQQLWLEIGIGAGTVAAMQALVARGLLPYVDPT